VSSKNKYGSLGFAGETPISGGLGAQLKLWQAEVEKFHDREVPTDAANDRVSAGPA
jgi:hypothetical protein